VLTIIQVVLGVSSVLMGTPPWLSALHLANAAAMLAMLVTITCRTASLPGAAAGLAPTRGTATVMA